MWTGQGGAEVASWFQEGTVPLEKRDFGTNCDATVVFAITSLNRIDIVLHGSPGLSNVDVAIVDLDRLAARYGQLWRLEAWVFSPEGERAAISDFYAGMLVYLPKVERLAMNQHFTDPELQGHFSMYLVVVKP